MRRYLTGATLFLLGIFMLTPAFGQDDEVMQLLKAGSDQIQGGHYQEAIEPLKKAISKKPDASKEMAGHYLLALAFTGLNRHQEAIEAFKEAIKLNPSFTNAYIGLGKCYFSLENYNEAAETYKKAVSLDPNNVLGHFSLGVAYVGMKRYQEAIEPLKKAISLKSDLADAHYYLGVAHAKLGDKDSALKELETLKNSNKKLAEGLQGEIDNIGKSGDLASGGSETNKQQNRIRVGIMAFKNKSSQPVSTQLLRARLIRRLTDSNFDAVPIDTNSMDKAEAEASQKGCEFILYTEVAGFTNERPLTDSGARDDDPFSTGGAATPGSGSGLGTQKTEVRLSFKLFRLGSNSPQFQKSVLGREDKIAGREDQIGLETVEQEGRAVTEELQKIAKARVKAQ